MENLEKSCPVWKSEKSRYAIEKLLWDEGGFVNDPEDPGGETHWGISKKWYPLLDIKALTQEEAIEIYYRDFWERYRYEEIEDRDIAEKVFSLAVNLGPGTAHVLVQLVVNELGKSALRHGSGSETGSKAEGGLRLKVDGILGSLTMAWVNDHPEPRLLLAELKLKAVEIYTDINNPRFLKGWIKRAIS